MGRNPSRIPLRVIDGDACVEHHKHSHAGSKRQQKNLDNIVACKGRTIIFFFEREREGGVGGEWLGNFQRSVHVKTARKKSCLLLSGPVFDVKNILALAIAHEKYPPQPKGA